MEILVVAFRNIVFTPLLDFRAVYKELCPKGGDASYEGINPDVQTHLQRWNEEVTITHGDDGQHHDDVRAEKVTHQEAPNQLSIETAEKQMSSSVEMQKARFAETARKEASNQNLSEYYIYLPSIYIG